ncbi:MAG: hypothetical protein HRU70_14440 [Phycisphaeraceae bacterium]|nr:MAG: hypothetical protein HRU70_14440 [Phycisphaeraceae bacterium]
MTMRQIIGTVGQFARRGLGRAAYAIGGGSRGGVRVLLAAVGAPAGVSRTRRGTFLILVVGTLALLAVITLIHFAVGQADRRTSTSLVRADRLEQVPDLVRDYIAQIIADDVVVRVPEDMNDQLPAERRRFRRESWDYPWTDWRYDSSDARETLGQGLANPAYFRVVGIGSDPWLASTEPTYLNFGVDSNNPHANAGRPYLDMRDWAQMSVVSPDGRAVNLYNLRNNFDAEPGFGRVGGRNRMSEGLWLSDQNGRPTNQTDFGEAATGAAARRPATWFSRQRGAFRPADADHARVDANLRPSRPEWLLYQFADADGDGFLDSRFQELVDARDPNAPVSALPNDGRIRWFVAPRIIDLSGLVNVNTASDAGVAPKASAPLGVSPADIDLVRLLQMQDAYDSHQQPSGLDGIRQPVTAPGVPPADPADYSTYNLRVAREGGLKAYDAMRASIDTLRIPETTETIQPWDWQNADRRFDYFRDTSGFIAGASARGTDFVMGGLFPAGDSFELLHMFGVNDPTITSRLELVLGGRLGTGQGVSRFSPLRDNRGLAVERDKRDLDGDGRADNDAMLQVAADARKRVTTYNGARPLQSRIDPSAGSLNSFDTKYAPRELFAANGSANAFGLFELYANALMGASNVKFAPGVNAPSPWPTQAGGGGTVWEQCRTMFYGHQGPELPLLLSAFMGVNMADAYDNDAESTKRTVLFDRSIRDRLGDPQGGNVNQPRNADNIPAFPWWTQGGFDVDPADQPEELSRLASTQNGEAPIAPAVNVFGIESQPFITQFGVYTAWVDMPPAGGGDPDSQPIDDPGGGGLGLPRGYITINGTIAANNSDFLFRAFVVQLTNPFDQPVTLSSAAFAGDVALNSEASFYYLRVTDDAQAVKQTIKLCEVSGEENGLPQFSGITIGPGETIVCYALSESLERIARKIDDADESITGTGPAAGRFRQWAQTQFGRNGANGVVRVVQVPRVTGAWVRDSSFEEFLSTGESGTGVQLWKAERADMTRIGGINELEPAGGQFVPNLTGNDRLMDRTRLGSGESLDRRLRQANFNVFRAFAWEPNIDPPGGNPNYNRGITITMYATARRPDDPDAGSIPLGGIPAYCIEPKQPGASWLRLETDPLGASPATFRVNNDQLPPTAELTMNEWFDAQASGTSLSSTLPVSPSRRSSGFPMPASRDGVPYGEARAEWGRPASDAAANPPVLPFRTRRTVNGQPVDVPTLRATDLLTPLAVGAFEAPLRTDGTAETNPERRYTTLGEALAMGFSYEPVPTDVNSAGLAWLFRPTAATTGTIGPTADRPVLSRGRLVLDDFATFFDGNRNGRFDYAAGSPDRIFGLGIPAALNILDMVSGFDPTYGGLERAARGVVNLNTASLPVLRTLPMLSPSDTGQWTQRAGWTGMPLDRRSDVAAMLAAWRDKGWTTFRTPSQGNYNTPDHGGDKGVTFIDGGVRSPVAPNLSAATFYSQLDGRAFAGQIEGLREIPGFRSSGEVLLARLRERAAFNAPNHPSLRHPSNIDSLGFNGDNDSRAGLDSVLYRETAGGLERDGLTDEMDERLILAAGLSNTTSVRSDVFACWFLIAGYTRQDCENLSADDPLVPSFQRRFFMIVDRTNVTREGQKPRILVFRELPVAR